MHQNKIEAWIGGESGGGGGVSSDLSTDPPILLPSSSISQKHPTQVQTPTTIHQPNGRNYWAQIPNPTRLEIHVSIPNSPEEAPHFHDQPIFGNPNHGPPAAPPQVQTTQAHLLSTPHKRPVMMTQAPPASSLSSYRHRSATDSQSESSKPSYCSSSSPSLPSYFCCFSPRALALKLLRDVRRARLLRVHLRFLILISLPSLYFFSSNPHRSFLVNFLFVLSFSAALVISLKLALPRLPSIRLFLARSLPTNIASLKNRSAGSRPVLWSIGSKPKPEKRPNSGSWVQTYSNGDVYEGEFHKGKCSGSGVYYYHMSGKYEGDWVDEKYDGFGVETWAKGSRYRGQYRLGLRHGLGVYRFYTGDVYAGEWSNGQSHGRGVHTCEDGSRYVGEFKWGVKHGLGHYHFRNGDTYAGEYFSDKVHGFGVYRFGNGHQYEGAWHEGRRQGLGMYTFRSGEIQSGHWQNGVLNVPSSRHSQPGSSYAVNHSKVLNAVQEARRAAEKAFDVVRVDERVNKAVAAANRAANAARVAAVKAVQKQMHHNNDNGDLPMPLV